MAAVLWAGVVLPACGSPTLQPTPSLAPVEEPAPGVEFVGSPPLGFELERCNGFDDDGDGRIDEGFPDLDGDGVADCVDAECQPAPVPPRPPLSAPASCLYTDVSDPWLWDVEVEDAWAGSPELGLSGRTYGPALAVQFDDDNGDGVVDDLDALDLVVIDWGPTHYREDDRLAVLSPGDWDVLHSAPANWPLFGVVRAVSGEEPSLVFGYMAEDAAIAYPTLRRPSQDLPVLLGEVMVSAGTVAWDRSSEGFLLGVSGVALPLAAGDGGPPTSVPPHSSTELIDFDGDGQLELLAGGGAWTLGGEELYLDPSVRAAGRSIPVVADFEPGGGLELLYLVDGAATAVDSGFQNIGVTDISPGPPSGPCAAPNDLPGHADAVWFVDGWPGVFIGYDWTNGVLWEVEGIDGTTGSACVAVDFNGDGLAEYVLVDSHSMRVVRGDSGAILFEWTDYGSGTASEHPLPVDLDGDGSLELVVSSMSGLFVLGSSASVWPAGASSWPTTGFRAGAWGPDGVPSGAPTGGSLRAAPMEAAPSAGRPDLVLQIVGECTSGCASFSRSRVVVRITNQGPAAFEGTGVLTVYRGEPSEASSGMSSSHLPAHFSLGPGESRDLPLPAVPARSWAGNDYSVSLVSIPAGEGRECDIGNNVAYWSADDCP